LTIIVLTIYLFLKRKNALDRGSRKEKHVSKRDKKKHKFSKVQKKKKKKQEKLFKKKKKKQKQRWLMGRFERAKQSGAKGKCSDINAKWLRFLISLFFFVFNHFVAQSMFLTFFRVLKTASNSPLLPAVLEGVARWCHLLNVDFMFEIVHALLKLLQQASLPLHSAFFCAITAFQVFLVFSCRPCCFLLNQTSRKALKNAGDVFRIDLSSYYHFVYPRLLQVPLVAREEGEWAAGETLEEVSFRFEM
jgi:hypothetical protein